MAKKDKQDLQEQIDLISGFIRGNSTLYTMLRKTIKELSMDVTSIEKSVNELRSQIKPHLIDDEKEYFRTEIKTTYVENGKYTSEVKIPMTKNEKIIDEVEDFICNQESMGRIASGVLEILNKYR